MTGLSPLTGDARKDFDALEECRGRFRVSKAELCRRADLNQSTYVLLLQRSDRVPHRRTITALRSALEALIFPAVSVAPSHPEAAE